MWASLKAFIFSIDETISLFLRLRQRCHRMNILMDGLEDHLNRCKTTQEQFMHITSECSIEDMHFQNIVRDVKVLQDRYQLYHTKHNEDALQNSIDTLQASYGRRKILQEYSEKLALLMSDQANQARHLSLEALTLRDIIETDGLRLGIPVATLQSRF